MNESIALRVHTTKMENHRPRRQAKKRASTNTQPWYEDWPRLIVALDCETTTDESQRLIFGAMRVYSSQRLVFEALFYSPQSTEDEIKALTNYARLHREGDIEGNNGLALTQLEVLDYHHFVNLLLRVIYTYGGVLVGFNIPFDISRIALGYLPPKKGFYKNGFIFHLNDYIRKGKKKASLYKPRIAFKSLGERRSLTSVYHPVRNRRREHSGYIVDLHTMAYALTETVHTLQSACQEFNTEHSKLETRSQGIITEENIDYCRNDVLITWELYNKLADEYRRHPIPTKPNRLFSSASLGKGYLKAMGIHLPLLDIDPELKLSANEVMGLAMSSYYGGRSETRIRKTIVPVAYLDFLSMYPTVNVLMGLWEMLTAAKVSVQDATNEVKQFVDSLTLEGLYDQGAWRKMSALVCIQPDGDFLPVRPVVSKNDNSGIYGVDWRFINSAPKGGLWYALPDIIASKLLAGKTPEIIQAIRFIPIDKQEGLRQVLLRDAVSVDPYQDDFFKKVIEERERLSNDESLSGTERIRHNRTLKYIANGAGYGIYVELNRNDSAAGRSDVQVYSKDTFRSSAGWLEEPGTFYFPPFATLITSAAHLMLAMLQTEVERRAGSYIFMDTDSMAIVSTVDGGNLDITVDKSSRAQIVALSGDAVMRIVAEFERLNPYNHLRVSETLLKIEPENKPLDKDAEVLSYIPGNSYPEYVTGKDLSQEDYILYAYSISTKRYALFNIIDGRYNLRKATQAILAQYISPFGGKDVEHTWIEYYWLWEVSGAHREYQAAFAQSPLIAPLTISTANLMSAFEGYNCKHSYADRIKPFGFLIHPVLCGNLGKLPKSARLDSDQQEKPVTLVARYSNNIYEALNLNYININAPGRDCRIVMEVFPGTIDNSAINWDTREYPTYVVRSIADYLMTYSAHPEGGMIDERGEVCKSYTKGVLYPASIEVGEVLYIGKETNLFDQWVSGIISPGEETLTIYKPDEWENEILPQLESVARYKIVEATRIDAGNIALYLSRKRRPGDDHLRRIKEALPQLLEEHDEWQDDVLPILELLPTSIIAQLTGLSCRHINYLKSSKRQPSPKTIDKLRVLTSKSTDSSDNKGEKVFFVRTDGVRHKIYNSIK